MKTVHSNRTRAAKQPSVPIPSNGFPIMWFGNMDQLMSSSLKIVTVAINPSCAELEEDATGVFLRYPHLNASNWTDWNMYSSGLNSYFTTKPNPWFKPFENVLNAFNETYGYNKAQQFSGQAVHLDFCSDLPTVQKWSDLSDADKKLLKNFNNPFFTAILQKINPQVVLSSFNTEYASELAAKLHVKPAFKIKKGIAYAMVYRSLSCLYINFRNMSGTPVAGLSYADAQKICQDIQRQFPVLPVSSSMTSLPLVPVTTVKGATVHIQRSNYKFSKLAEFIECYGNRHHCNLSQLQTIFPASLFRGASNPDLQLVDSTDVHCNVLHYTSQPILVDGYLYYVLVNSSTWKGQNYKHLNELKEWVRTHPNYFTTNDVKTVDRF